MIPQVTSGCSAWLIFLRWLMILNTKILPPNVNDLRKHLQHRDQWVSLMRLLGSYLDPRVLHPSGRKRRHHCLNFIHSKQLSPFPERLELPFPCEEILSGYEDVVSSGTDQFTTWVKTDPGVTSVRHMVDIQKAIAEFREASARRHDASSQVCHFDNNAPNRSPVQKRLSIYNWNPGTPTRKRRCFLREQIAGKWHVITLQEAIDNVDHELLTNRFHVTHYGGCAVLFNKDTFYPKMKSSLFPFVVPGANCLIKCWKETRGGFCKECFHVPHFVDLLSAARKHSQFSPYI